MLHLFLFLAFKQSHIFVYFLNTRTYHSRFSILTVITKKCPSSIRLWLGTSQQFLKDDNRLKWKIYLPDMGPVKCTQYQKYKGYNWFVVKYCTILLNMVMGWRPLVLSLGDVTYMFRVTFCAAWGTVICELCSFWRWDLIFSPIPSSPMIFQKENI